MRCGKASRSPIGPAVRVMIAGLWQSWGSWARRTAAEGGAGGDASGYDSEGACVDVDVGAGSCAGAGHCAVAGDGA